MSPSITAQGRTSEEPLVAIFLPITSIYLLMCLNITVEVKLALCQLYWGLQELMQPIFFTLSLAFYLTVDGPTSQFVPIGFL